MVIDSHLHLIRKKYIDEDTLKRLKVGIPKDTEIDQLVAWLKEADVKRAVVMGQDMTRILNSTFGEDYVLEIFKKYPDYFIPLASVEPLDKFNRFNKEAFEYFVKSIEEYGFKGLLLTPPMGSLCLMIKHCILFTNMHKNGMLWCSITMVPRVGLLFWHLPNMFKWLT